MPVSRRQFILGSSAAALISARGYEAWAQSAADAATGNSFVPDQTTDLLLDSNENPIGPGRHVIDAVLAAIGEDGAGAGRYVFAQQAITRQAIADSIELESANILLGAGSTELLRLVVDVHTARDKPFVTADPSFPAAERYAALLGHPVVRIPLDENFRVDLDAMLAASDKAGVVYVCNPNNPTATVRSGENVREFIESLTEGSPDTKILIDEAYAEYVGDPSFESVLSLVSRYPQLIVAKTFSKVYGMAGLRIGYIAAHADTIAQIARIRGMDMYTSYPSRAAAIAALGNQEQVNQERSRNAEVRTFTEDFFNRVGINYVPSQTNFVFFDTDQPFETFKAACLGEGVRVRAQYPNYPTHARVSLGTMSEMQRATEVFSRLL